MTEAPQFNIAFVGQAGRIQYEALILVASLSASIRGARGRILCMEPQPGPLWFRDPRINNAPLRAMLEELGVDFVPFESKHFGQSYPNGNKIEGLAALPEGEPFLFLDTDTLILDDLRQVPFDFERPSASLRRENTWPKIELYGPGYTAIWKSLYDKFGIDFESSIDQDQPDEFWRRYLYFNAGFFYGTCPVEFGRRFTEIAVGIRDDRPDELECQTLDPWLDQVALPLVIHSLGGGRDTLAHGYMDGSHHCHYRTLSLLYAREDQRVIDVLEDVIAPNRIKKLLKEYEPALRMIYQGRGAKARALFDQNDLPRKEQAIRNRLKREGFWMR
ncbi:MAG: glycosyltransferase family 2 protein [Marinovum sp.]|nr:glycosyltransferase family 2 protein [Marinovum sp.]